MAKGALPRKKRKTPEHVKRAADRAALRSSGKDPLAVEAEKPATPLDPPETHKPRLPKIGRPTKYRAEFCERIVELGAKGKSKAQMAAALGVTYDAWNDWEKRHPAFFHAVKVAERLCLSWWEDQGQAGIHAGKEFNAVAFIFQMKNRFKNDYSDRTETTHKLDASQSFLQLFQAISAGHGAKLIEGKPA